MKNFQLPFLIFGTFFASLLAAVVLASLPVEGDASLFLGYLVSPIILLAASLIFFRARRMPLKDALPVSFDWEAGIFSVFSIIGIFAAAVLPAFLMDLLSGKLGIPYSVEVPAANTPLKIFLSVLILAVLPAIGEEIFFRKALLDALEGFKPFQIALLSGLIFALWHLNFGQFLHQFFLGVFLSMLFQRTRSILYPVLLHIINNLLALFLSDTAFFLSLSLSGTGLVYTLALFFGGIVVFLISCFFLFRKKGRINNKLNQRKAFLQGDKGFANGRNRESALAAAGTLIVLAVIWVLAVIVSAV